MLRHLIVTCGASQIDNVKVSMLGTGRPVKEWKAVLKFVERVKETKKGIRYNTWWRDDEDVQVHSQVFVDALALEWENKRMDDSDKGSENLDKLITLSRNPFGAEISTLFKMATKQPPVFDPQKDKVTLLYSDTQSGGFCVNVLYHLLIHKRTWKMAPGQLEPKRVPELREEPSNVEEAEKNLHTKVHESRKEDAQNIFVITGGFKSIIPAITVYALVYGEDLYYLFEESTQLRKLELPAEIKSSGRWWTLARKLVERKDQRGVIVVVRTGIGPRPVEPDLPPLE
jgi:putative CRISPR-associated protein (TIGR02619 family)